MNLQDPVFHIGYSKTGTKWLQLGYLAQHPGIADLVSDRRQWDNPVLRALVLSPPGLFEPTYCQELFQQDWDRHCKGKKLPVYSAERLAGHPFSGGYDGIHVARRIGRAFPQARVLIVIRNQLTLLPSLYKEMLVGGYLGRFEDLIHPDPAILWAGPAFSLQMLNYCHLVDEYKKWLPGENVRVLLYEELLADPAGFLESISSFMGIGHIAPDGLYERRIVSGQHKGTSGHRLWNHFRRTLIHPYPLLNLGAVPKLGRLIRPILRAVSPKPRMLTPELETELVERFKESNQALKLHLSPSQISHLQEYPGGLSPSSVPNR